MARCAPRYKVRKFDAEATSKTIEIIVVSVVMCKSALPVIFRKAVQFLIRSAVPCPCCSFLCAFQYTDKWALRKQV